MKYSVVFHDDDLTKATVTRTTGWFDKSYQTAKVELLKFGDGYTWHYEGGLLCEGCMPKWSLLSYRYEAGLGGSTGLERALWKARFKEHSRREKLKRARVWSLALPKATVVKKTGDV